MTRRALSRSIAGIAAAALLTFSLGACVSGAKSMKKSADSSMQKTTMNGNTTMKSTTNDSTMKSSTNNSTMSK